LKNQEECGNAAEIMVKGDPRCEPEYSFQRNERLKGRSYIQAVFKQGKKLSCQGAKLFVLKNNLTNNRICFTFSRGFGNAVKRNRARRLGREAYRLLRPRLRGGYDLILLIFPETQASLAARTRQLEFLFSKAGLWNDRNTK
jgi:ribonuclease P protein component